MSTVFFYYNPITQEIYDNAIKEVFPEVGMNTAETLFGSTKGDIADRLRKVFAAGLSANRHEVLTLKAEIEGLKLALSAAHLTVHEHPFANWFKRK